MTLLMSEGVNMSNKTITAMEIMTLYDHWLLERDRLIAKAMLKALGKEHIEDIIHDKRLKDISLIFKDDTEYLVYNGETIASWKSFTAMIGGNNGQKSD